MHHSGAAIPAAAVMVLVGRRNGADVLQPVGKHGAVLGYGSWVSFGNQMETKESKVLMSKAREAGINFFDSAEVYANGRAEEIIGEVVKELGWKRSDLVITTKVFWGGPGPNDKGLSRKHIIEGTKKCLQRLQMDYVDIMLCHRPDATTPLEETVRAMNYVVDAYYWGTSEWSAQQIIECCEIAKRLGMMGPVTQEPEYNLLAREKVEVEFLPLYQKYGILETSGIGSPDWEVQPGRLL